VFGGLALLPSLIQLAGRVRARVPRVRRVAGRVVLGSSSSQATQARCCRQQPFAVGLQASAP
jgi:hypothetical protein